MGGVMGFSLVLFWCAAVARAALRNSYGISVSNSRLAANEFPLRRQRGIARQAIGRPPNYRWENGGSSDKLRNSCFHGNSRECRPLANGCRAKQGKRMLRWQTSSLPGYRFEGEG